MKFTRAFDSILRCITEEKVKSPKMGTYLFDITKRFLDIDLFERLEVGSLYLN